MIARKVKLAFVGGLDLIYIHKPYPFSHISLHSHSSQKTTAPHPNTRPKFFFGRATVSVETLVSSIVFDVQLPYCEILRHSGATLDQKNVGPSNLLFSRSSDFALYFK